MADQSVTPPPTYGSVESFEDQLRRSVMRDAANSASYMLGVVEALVGNFRRSDADTVQFIRNAFAAAERVRKESADQSGLDYSRPADGDDPQQIGQREPLHTGAVTEAGLVDVTEPDPLIPDDLRETVHWRTSGLPRMVIACGAQSGPHSADLLKVTCKSCLDQVPF